MLYAQLRGMMPLIISMNVYLDACFQNSLDLAGTASSSGPGDTHLLNHCSTRINMTQPYRNEMEGRTWLPLCFHYV